MLHTPTHTRMYIVPGAFSLSLSRSVCLSVCLSLSLSLRTVRRDLPTLDKRGVQEKLRERERKRELREG